MTRLTPREEIFRCASDPDDGRVRGAALKPQGARSSRVQGGPRLADTRERLNPALRQLSDLRRVFILPRQLLVSESRGLSRSSTDAGLEEISGNLV